MMNKSYSYFLVLIPPPATARLIDRLRVRYGLDRQIVERDRLHMTVGKLAVRHPFPLPDIAGRVDAAFAGRSFPGCEIMLDRLSGGALESSDRLSGLHRLHADISEALCRAGLIGPGGRFYPHMSLSYASARGVSVVPRIAWRATEMDLIESLHGRHIHRRLKRWTLSRREMPSIPRQLEIWNV